MFGILEAVAVPNNGIFNSFEDLMHTLHSRVTKEGYKIVRARSHRGRVGGASIPGNEMVRCDLVCERGGRPYRSTATKHKTSTKKTDCPWKAKAVYRKTIGGWVLTIECDQHNHEAGTPEPPTPPDGLDNEDAEAEDEAGPRPDQETSLALQIAGVSSDDLRLTGDTFHRFKNDYRKMPQPERLAVLSQLQLRIAAIYAVQNEEVQRKARQESQKRRHQNIDDGRRDRATQKQRARRQQQQQAAGQPQTQPQQQQQQLQPQSEAEQFQHQTPEQSHAQRLQQQPSSQQVSQIPLPQRNPQLQHNFAEQRFQLAEGPNHQTLAIPAMDMAGMTPYSSAHKHVRGGRAQ